MGLTTSHSISSPLPTPGKFRGSNPGLAFPATRLIQEPPRVTSSQRGNLQRFLDPCHEWGGGWHEDKRADFLSPHTWPWRVNQDEGNMFLHLGESSAVRTRQGHQWEGLWEGRSTLRTWGEIALMSWPIRGS